LPAGRRRPSDAGHHRGRRRGGCRQCRGDARSARSGDGVRRAGAHRAQDLTAMANAPAETTRRVEPATTAPPASDSPAPRPAAPVPPADWPSTWPRLTRPRHVFSIIDIYPEDAYRLPIIDRRFRGRRHLIVNDLEGIGHVLQHNVANYVKGRKLQRVLS